MVFPPFYLWGITRCCCCRDCLWTDPFDSELDGYSDATFSLSSEDVEFTVGAGSLNLSNGSPAASGSRYQRLCFEDPDLVKLRVRSTVTHSAGGDGTYAGIFVGNARALVLYESGGEFQIRVGRCDGVGENASLSDSGEVSDDATATLELVLEEAADNTFSVRYFVDDVCLLAESAVTFPTSFPFSAFPGGREFNSGVLAVEGGAWEDLEIECDNLPDSSECPDLFNCPLCPLGTAAFWEVTFSGTNCVGFNKTHTLNPGAGTCGWRTPIGSVPIPCGLFANSFMNFQLLAGGARLAENNGTWRYESAPAPAECFAANVLTKVVDGTSGANLPNQVTVFPA